MLNRDAAEIASWRSPRFGVRFLLIAMSLSAIEMTLVRLRGAEMLAYVPFLGALLGAWVWSLPSQFRLLQQSLGGGIGAALGLLLTNALWHFVWPAKGLDFGWHVGVLLGLMIHTAAGFAALATAGFAVGLLLDAIRRRNQGRRNSQLVSAICWGVIVGWPIAYGRLLIEPLYFYDGYLTTVPFIAWFPGELVRSAFVCFGIALVVAPILWGIARLRIRHGRQARSTECEVHDWGDWDAGLPVSRRAAIALPPPKLRA